VTHTLGVELQDHRAAAVAIDDTGRIVGRAAVASTDLAAAAAAAIDGVASGASGSNAVLGVSAFSPDLPESSAALKALAARFPKLPAAAIGSGTASAIAEAWCGAAKGAADVAFFGAAEHVTAGVVRADMPVLGAHRRALAIGWLALNPVEREDYRKIGCLEAEVGASGIVRRLVWRIKAGDRSRVQDAVDGDLGAITAPQILDAARAGDGVSISVVRDTAKYLGMAAANMVVMADPTVLVLGGMMSTAADLLLEPVKLELSRRVPPSVMQTLKVVPAALGADAAAVGAARLAAIQ
jgi:glucokinase